MKTKKYYIGIDEVGRGSLAGPVAVAAVFMPKNLRIRPCLPAGRNKKLGKLKDSKKLTAKRRELWLKHFKNCPKIYSAVSMVEPRLIEKINISNAANLAATRAVRKLMANHKLRIGNCKILLDGGLYLNDIRGYSCSNSRLFAKTIIKGDEKITAIKIASIIAKVHRDKLMVGLAKKYPQYGFEIHKGYGTKRHYEALNKFGPSEIHRKSFIS